MSGKGIHKRRDGQENAAQAHTEHGNGQRCALCTKQKDFTASQEVSIFYLLCLPFEQDKKAG